MSATRLNGAYGGARPKVKLARRRAVAGLALALALAVAPKAAFEARAADAEPVTIVAFGDSLTAGYGLPPEESFPAKLEAELEAAGIAARVENAGVSGDTSSGGLQRLDWAVGPEADAVIVELGANDALRGVDPAETERNLDAIVGNLRARGLPVLVAGMRAPPNMGAEYETAFNSLYARVAKRHGALLYPFFLDGVAARPELNLPDGIHPNGDGVAIIARRMAPMVSDLAAAARR